MRRAANSKAQKTKRNGRPDLSASLPKRICIVTRDLYGIRSLTDAGAATLGLAQYFAEAGETVTMVWVPPIEVTKSLDAAARSELADNLAGNYLVNLEIISDSPFLSPHLHSPEKASLAVYYYLKSRSFDEVFCTLEGGLAYYTLLAEEMSLLNPAWRLVLLVHTPTEWLAEADKQYFRNLKDISTAHMERYCVENAGFAVFNSNYIRDWVLKRGWRIPEQAATVLPLMPQQLRLPERHLSSQRQEDRAPELGIWPGWEFQRGLMLFCDALDRLARQHDFNCTVNVFGPFSRLLGEHTGGLVVRRSRQWPFMLRFFPHLSERESLDYLKQKNGIAVLPDLTASGSRMLQACLEANIPLVATNTGSNPELVKSVGKGDLCAPLAAALADSIKRCLAKPRRPVEPAHSRTEMKRIWDQVRTKFRNQDKPAQATSTKKSRQRKPLVSIVIAHFDRPEFLADAIKSVECQDYPSIEVVLVDDGSVKPESHRFLKSLEPSFRRRGWKIIRQENRYLGAARNAGIKASRGSHVLFLDDDNALLVNAVTTFVTAIESSQADICTSMSKIFLGPHIPAKPNEGLIEYFPLGGSLNFAFVHNSFGDANAMIRRNVFDKIGYLLEDRGFVASDWEFFTRAALHGLKVRIIPESTYWYRSSPEGMFRSAHWYDTRLPILKLFQEHKFRGLDHIWQLLLANTTDESEQQSYHFRLRYSLSNASYEKLDHLVPDSDEAFQQLAGIAASEGRPDTALNLLGQVKSSNFAELAYKGLAVVPISEMAISQRPLAPAQESVIDLQKLKGFAVASTDPAADPPLSYVIAPNLLLVQAVPGATTVATLAAALPAGSIKLSIQVKLPEDVATPVEIIAALLEPGLEATEALLATPGTGTLASSGWLPLRAPYESRVIKLDLANPIKAPGTLVLGSRCAAGFDHPRKTMVQFGSISYLAFIGLGQPRHPRTGAPPTHQGARVLTDKDLRAARLTTAYKGERPLLEFPANEKGFILRPSKAGVVVARLEWAFPAFARGVIASVEIAHENASAFEFAMALVRPSDVDEWSNEGPKNCAAFSGWHRVERKFELHEVKVELREAVRYSLSICAAIRLPPGANPIPSQSFWRKLVLVWDD